MAVVLGLEGFDKNDVGVDVVGEHYVVIAAAGVDGEAAHVVGVELGDGFDADVEFFCGFGGLGMGAGLGGLGWFDMSTGEGMGIGVVTSA